MSGVEDTPALRRVLGLYIGTLWAITPEGSTDPALEVLLDSLDASQEMREGILSIADERALEMDAAGQWRPR
jgi:hypothetical protein